LNRAGWDWVIYFHLTTPVPLTLSEKIVWFVARGLSCCRFDSCPQITLPGVAQWLSEFPSAIP
jgi:hypothetical protein